MSTYNDHTPGPWTATIYSDDWPHKTEVKTEDGHMIAGTDYFESCDEDNGKRRQDEANARLIAAAPDLYAALKALQFLSSKGVTVEFSDLAYCVDAVKKAEEG